MKKAWFTVLAVGLAAFAPLAAAVEGAYHSELTFDQGLPSLRTGGGADGPHNLDGEWTDLGQRYNYANLRDQVGVGADGSAQWADWRRRNQHVNYQGPRNAMGEGLARNVDPTFVAQGMSQVNHAYLGTTAWHNGAGAAFDMQSQWTRGFSLDAGESMTFTALAGLSIAGNAAAPLNMRDLLEDGEAGASAFLVDADNRLGVGLVAALSSFSSSFGYVFQARQENGRLSLSITNHGDTALTGWLRAESFINFSAPTGISAPVPEPLTVAMVLFGSVVVGAAAKRRPGRG